MLNLKCLLKREKEKGSFSFLMINIFCYSILPFAISFTFLLDLLFFLILLFYSFLFFFSSFFIYIFLFLLSPLFIHFLLFLVFLLSFFYHWGGLLLTCVCIRARNTVPECFPICFTTRSLYLFHSTLLPPSQHTIHN